ncbi:hypothetical protein AAFF_G00001860 [Aldrovandia affinis]|uniref:Tumor necrosis factor-inducible gene 6 protein n=1 Tax=Aldrovandia affinis TaxID=143900 RepID=A0AAD7TDM1_9TELE|nr:hypothetical protein AAFF_G00001860 [Aldrovandia affinis]
MFSCEHYLSRRVVGVFHYDRNNRYSLTFMEARLACERDFGATIADRKQLQAANEGGLEECRAGWISEAEVAYPRLHLSWNCGQNQTGIISYGVRKDLLEKWDVFCYKMDVTSPHLDFIIGITGETPETTTTMSCGGWLNEEDGHFQSPGFPYAYHSNMDCTWVISVQEGHLVQLNFHSMVLEEHRGCQYDYVTVFDGRASEKQELGRFCGSELPPPLMSSSNTMTVQMRSDSSVELDGFSVHFHTVKSPGHVRLRGGMNQFEGRVEVDVDGVRGSVCAKQWGNSEAAVVCRQLGFKGNAVATRTPGSMDDLPVAVSFMKCQGQERSLAQCEMKRGGGCTTADRAAVHCQVVESCSVLRDAGTLESGTYIIDPDGPGQGQNPFPVYCDMDSQPGAGVTVVSHNSESRVRAEPCEEAGCYSREVVYRHASLLQLRALIHTSLSCSQRVKLECRHIRFLGAQWGWWTSWDGRRVDSWGGATTGSRRCACGERGDCDLGLSTCNCDANDAVWRFDDGFLSDMVLLPIREVRFGDTRDVPMEMAFHTIGPLQCRGHKSRETVLVSCAALKEAGITKSGQYHIDPDGMGHGVSQFEVYCDMTSDPLTGVTVVGHDGEGRARVSPCEEPGCYSRELHYEADMPQLRALVQTSASCQQHVKLDCRHTRFVESGWGWWVSWVGQKRLDWGGATNNSGSCACGMTDTCNRPGLLCNCDSNDHIWRSDEGFLTDKSALPVRAVYFGDTKDIPLEMAFHTIGKFTCKGRGSHIL